MLNLIKKIKLSLPLKIAIGFILFYFLFGYFGVNPLAKRLVPWFAKNYLASSASVEQVNFDPLRLKTTINHFKLTNPQGAPLTSFDQLVVDLEASGIFDWAWKLKEISLTKPQGYIHISPQGQLNWDELLNRLNSGERAPPNKTLPRVLIEQIIIKNGLVKFEDQHRATPFKTELTPLNFELAGFSTLPKDRGDYLFAATFADQGGSLKWKGNLGVNPIASKGDLAVTDLKLAQLLGIIKGVELPFKPSHGSLEAHFHYDLSMNHNQPKVSFSQFALGIHQLHGLLNQNDQASISTLTVSSPQFNLGMQDQTKLNLQDLRIELVDATANIASNRLSIEKANTYIPQFDLLVSQDVSIQSQNIQVNFEAFSAASSNGSLLTVHNASAQLPTFALNKQLPFQFDHLSLKIADINLKHQADSLFKLPVIELNELAFNLPNRHIGVGQILLAQGEVSAIRDQRGNLNWQSAFAPSVSTISKAQEDADAVKTDAAAPFNVEIADIALKNWKVSLADQSFKNPLTVSVADANLNLALSNPNGAWTVSNLQSEINNLSLTPSHSTAAATLAKIQLNQAGVSLDKRKIGIESLLLSGFKVEVIKTQNGTLNWQDILKTNITSLDSATKSNKDSNKNKWSLSLKKIALDRSQVHIEDRTTTQAVAFDVQNIALEANNASLNLAQAIPVKTSFQVKQGGQFNGQGRLTLAPFKLDTQLELSKLAFKPFSPYLNQQVLLKIDDGVGSIKGKLHADTQKKLALTFNGGFNLQRLALLEEKNNAPFLTWNKVSGDQLAFSLMPNRLHINTLNIEQPTGKFIINNDKTTNLSNMLRNGNHTTPDNAATTPIPNAPANETPIELASTQANTTAKEATHTEMAQSVLSGQSLSSNTRQAPTTPTIENTSQDNFPVMIETIRINGAAVEFADLSLTPQFGTQIHSLSGVVNSVSTNPNTTAQVELDGKVDEYGSARVRGALQPFKATNFTDIKLNFTNLEMNRLTPYSGKFAGRRIDSGKLSVDLEYKIKQRQLAGENKFIINKLKLGEKIDSKEAADLPLDLAIAILEDSDGVIDLDLPISGSLDDPKFSYGSIVWKAIRNVLGKIVTAPFRALGKLFGGSGDKLEAINFDAGSATLNPPELEKIKAINNALSKRQGLALGIVAGFDKALDSRAIQENTLRLQVAQEMEIELATGQQAGPIDLNNPKAQKAVDTLYDKLTKKGLLKRLASKLEKPKAGHYEEAQEKLTQSIEVKEADLQTLAKSRATAIQQALLTAGTPSERVHIGPFEAAKSDAKAKTVNIRLTLDTKSAHQAPEPSQELTTETELKPTK